MPHFSAEGIEELIKRVAIIASEDEQFWEILACNHIKATISDIQQAIKYCDIIIKNNDVLMSFPSSVSAYVVPTGGRISDIINDEIGETLGFIMVDERMKGSLHD